MLLQFRTASGSEYRVNYATRTIERLTGQGAPTDRVGSGPRKFETLSTLQVGRPALICWGEHSATPAVTGAEPATVTSPIVSMEWVDPD